MSTTILTFCENYYLYDGDLEIENRGLTIRGYESAWLADLAMSFLLDNSKDIIQNTIYFGMYRDDGIGIFDGDVNIKKASWWLKSFQKRVNIVAGNDFLKFTMEIWKEGHILSESEKANKSITINPNTFFPFLDMKLSWDEKNSLNFGVYLKPNQELKYLNKGSAHTPSCFKAITTGVIKRLTKLTTISESNKETPINEIYPLHFKALSEADLIGEQKIPTLGEKKKEMEEENENQTTNKLKRRRERDRRRAIYFKSGIF